MTAAAVVPSSRRTTLLTPVQAAEITGLSVSTLAKLRVYGGSPPFKKLGGRCFYPEAELMAWLDGQPTYRSTSEYLPADGPRRGRPRRAGPDSPNDP